MSETQENQAVMGWIGKMGSGKTLNMTKWALVFAEALSLPIHSNYTINYHNAFKFTDFRQLEDQHDCIVVYDEIHIDFDSRDWDKKIRYQFTQWFTQLRKRNIIFLYSTQRPNTLEKRIRENTDFLFRCEKLTNSLNSGKKLTFWQKAKSYLFSWANKEYKPATAFREELLDTQMGFEQATPIRRWKIAKPQLLYNLYNTREVIKKDFY